jgi:hypothetical protein
VLGDETVHFVFEMLRSLIDGQLADDIQHGYGAGSRS